MKGQAAAPPRTPAPTKRRHSQIIQTSPGISPGKKRGRPATLEANWPEELLKKWTIGSRKDKNGTQHPYVIVPQDYQGSKEERRRMMQERLRYYKSFGKGLY